MQQDRDKIKDALQPLILDGLMASCPPTTWELAAYLKERQAEIQAALQVANRIAPIITSLGNLFPYGWMLMPPSNSWTSDRRPSP